jgi:photosynthetic reaction center H subunit
MAVTFTGNIDIALVTLYTFWLFFAGLVFYLLRENKREGYPMITGSTGRVVAVGFPAPPSPKVLLPPHGDAVLAPAPVPREEPPVRYVPSAPFIGAPVEPTGDPMVDGVGPAAYAWRADKPHLAFDDHKPAIQPLRIAKDYRVAEEDPDPRGWNVVGADGIIAGVCTDLWVDRSETIIRYLEVEVTATGKRAMVPMPLVRLDEAKKQVKVKSVLAEHFAKAPTLQSYDQITLREEDRTSAFFASGHLYATPSRMGPVL